MIEPRRQAYLEALGIDVWVARPPAPEPGRLVYLPGEGSTLLITAGIADRDRPLVADIARAVGGSPAWAWPDPEGTVDSPDLEDVVRDGLFTRVIVFGAGVAAALFEGETPRIVASAAVTVAAGIDELETRGSSKQALWRLISQVDSNPSRP